MPREIDDMPTRKWGVELECLSTIQRSKLIRATKAALRDNGYPARMVEQTGYNHDGPGNTKWKWKTDSSCGWELVSPVLSGWKGLHEMSCVIEGVDALADQEGERLVDSRCGVHVNVDVRDLGWQQVKNIAVAGKVWEPLFYAVNPYSRNPNVGRENGYCAPIKWNAVDMKNAQNKDHMHRIYRSSRAGLNIGKWWNTGAIEFRYFSGTYAFEKASAAVMLSVLFVEAVSRKNRIRIGDAQLRMDHRQIWQAAGRVGFDSYVEKFFRDLLMVRSGATPAFRELKNYVLKRVDTFYNNDGSAKGQMRGQRGRRPF